MASRVDRVTLPELGREARIVPEVIALASLDRMLKGLQPYSALVLGRCIEVLERRLKELKPPDGPPLDRELYRDAIGYWESLLEQSPYPGVLPPVERFHPSYRR